MLEKRFLLLSMLKTAAYFFLFFDEYKFQKNIYLK